MEGPTAAEPLATPILRPSSPPVTPNSNGSSRGIRGRTPPNWKRMGMYGLMNLSPPSDDGSTHEPQLRPATPELLFLRRSSSRPSTPSGIEDSPRRNLQTPDIDSQSEASERRPSPLRRRRDEFELVIEELADDDPRYMNRSGILRPDVCEDADSERAPSSYHDEEAEMVKQFEELHWDDEESKREDLRRWIEKKKKRVSHKSKRTFSESCGSQPDDEDTKTLDFNEVGASARRVKRRISGANERTSLIFDDPPPEHITEVDEPDDERDLFDAPPPYTRTPYSRTPVDWSSIMGLTAMPFYSVSDPMRVDTDSDTDTESGYSSDSSG